MPETLRLDPQLEQRQVARTRKVREARDGAAAQAALDAISFGAEGEANLVPLILDGVRSECTRGESSDALRGVFGLHQEVVVL